MCKESYAFFFMWQLWKFQPWWPPLTLSPLLSSAWIAARNHASNNSLSVVSGVKWERRAFGHHFGHFPSPFYSFLVGSFLSPAPSFTEEETRQAKSRARPQLGFWLSVLCFLWHYIRYTVRGGWKTPGFWVRWAWAWSPTWASCLTFLICQGKP